jgi:hypothetical protein
MGDAGGEIKAVVWRSKIGDIHAGSCIESEKSDE